MLTFHQYRMVVFHPEYKISILMLRYQLNKLMRWCRCHWKARASPQNSSPNMFFTQIDKEIEIKARLNF